MTEESSSSKTPQVALATATESPEIKDPRAAQLSAAGHWGETQVIEHLKEANWRRRDPRRVLSGEVTQAIGGIFHPVRPAEGALVTPRRSWRHRLRRLFGYFKA